MTIASAEREPSGYCRQQIGFALDGMRGLLSFARLRWRKWREIRANHARLDEMPPEQLADLGLRRVGHSVRWLDLGGKLQVEEFEYRALSMNPESDRRF